MNIIPPGKYITLSEEEVELTEENSLIKKQSVLVEGLKYSKFSDGRSRYIQGPIEHLGKLVRDRGTLSRQKNYDLDMSKIDPSLYEVVPKEEGKQQPLQLDLFN